jgi:hypothetical protein
VLAHCAAHPEVTTRKGAKTFQVKVTPAGLSVVPANGQAIVFSRADLERGLRAILGVRSSKLPMTAASLEARGVGPQALYIWGILGHMNLHQS